MGEIGTEPTLPLRVTVDDVEATKRLARYLGRTRAGRWAALAAPCLNGALLLCNGIWMLHSGFPGVMWLIVLGTPLYVFSVTFAIVFRKRLPVVPTDFVITADGVAFRPRGESRERSYPWRRIASVSREDDAYVLTIRGGLSWSSVYVPKPADTALADAMWMTFYRHLISTGALRPTSPDQLSVLSNSAYRGNVSA